MSSVIVHWKCQHAAKVFTIEETERVYPLVKVCRTVNVAYISLKIENI